LVDALDLDVEDRLRIDTEAGLALEVARERGLAGALVRAPSIANACVLDASLACAPLVAVRDPRVGSDDLVRERAELGVALLDPTARRHAVGLVAEAPRKELIELGEHLLAQQAAVQLAHAVHAEAPDDREVRHAHVALRAMLHDRHSLD